MIQMSFFYLTDSTPNYMRICLWKVSSRFYLLFVSLKINFQLIFKFDGFTGSIT